MQGRRSSRSRAASVVGLGRSPARRGGSSGAGRRLRLPVLPTTRGSRSRKRVLLRRSASEPALWYDARVHPVPRDLSPPSPPPPPLERPHTCYDDFPMDSPFASSASLVPSLPDRKPWEEAKVVVSVTVEGSAGPVKAMVRLGSSIREAIAAVVERYDREGRSPRLDPASADCFQLHHSHFCLQSLNKNDKIGDVGGRNFYLHKNDGSNGLVLQREESGVNLSGGAITQSYGGALAGVPYHHQFFAIVSKKLDKINRRAKRIWRVLTCNCT